MSSRALWRIWLPIGLGALLGVALFLFAPGAGAQTPGATQSTPSVAAGTPAVTAEPNVATLVKITVQQDKPFKSGQEFAAVVSVDNVEHLAGFEFAITYDPKRLSPVYAAKASQPGGTADQSTPVGGSSSLTVKTANLGQFLKSSGRTELHCSQPTVIQNGQMDVLCNLLGPPLCFGGAPGVSGSGELASIYFKSKGGGLTTLSLSKTGLALDNFDTCTAEVTGTAALPGACLPIRDAAGPSATQLGCKPDGTSGVVVEGPVDAAGVQWVRLEGLGWAQTDYLQATGKVPPIPHRRQDATVLLAKNTSHTLLIGLIVGVVVVLVVGAGGGFVLYRRRQAGSSA